MSRTSDPDRLGCSSRPLRRDPPTASHAHVDQAGSKRAGFSLVEAIVALLLLSVAALSLSGAANVSAGLLRDASLSQGAAFEAAAVIDSLVARLAVGADSLTRGPYALSWSAADSNGTVHIELEVRYSAGGRERQFRAGRWAGAPPPRVDRVP